VILKAVAFDFGHTLVDERKDEAIPLASRPVYLMPHVLKILPQVPFPMAVWANTRTASELDLHPFFDRAGIGKFFTWVVTSADAGHRKPASEFFDFAFSKCGLPRDEVLFVGNQLNTDILGGMQYGIATVWLAGRAYRSADETLSLEDMQPTYKLASLLQLPGLLGRICGDAKS
jgi:FMN phosphatase YigB (HAD superfamily)